MRKNREEVHGKLLKRNFFALESNKKYVSDLTYLYGRECVKYLSLIEDLFNGDNNERQKQSLGGLSSVQFWELNPKGTYLMVIKD